MSSLYLTWDVNYCSSFFFYAGGSQTTQTIKSMWEQIAGRHPQRFRLSRSGLGPENLHLTRPQIVLMLFLLAGKAMLVIGGEENQLLLPFVFLTLFLLSPAPVLLQPTHCPTEKKRNVWWCYCLRFWVVCNLGKC